MSELMSLSELMDRILENAVHVNKGVPKAAPFSEGHDHFADAAYARRRGEIRIKSRLMELVECGGLVLRDDMGIPYGQSEALHRLGWSPGYVEIKGIPADEGLDDCPAGHSLRFGKSLFLSLEDAKAIARDLGFPMEHVDGGEDGSECQETKKSNGNSERGVVKRPTALTHAIIRARKFHLEKYGKEPVAEDIVRLFEGDGYPEIQEVLPGHQKIIWVKADGGSAESKFSAIARALQRVKDEERNR
ncbi:MAG TPA: hypothetical protein ENK48_08375 [Gammaproteobacteria bacterium]|nr:hypothetical protein [Gammaproteobacteria bacterium]